jgi:hypothetical protein
MDPEWSQFSSPVTDGSVVKFSELPEKNIHGPPIADNMVDDIGEHPFLFFHPE